MIASGIETPAILQAGRWKSASMVQRYGERLLAKRNGAAQLPVNPGDGWCAISRIVFLEGSS